MMKLEGVTVADAADTALGTFNVEGFSEGVFTIKNTHASRAFDVFKILTRTHPDAPQMTASSIATDFSNKVDPVMFSSGTPVTLAGNASCNIRVNLKGVYEISFVAQANGGAGTAAIYGSCS